MTDYRSQSANISHMPTVSRVMLAIGVEPVTSTYAQTGSKVRGQCQSCLRSQEQKVEHRCTECQQFVCGKHGKNNRVGPTIVWSVHCGCDLTLAMTSEQETVDRASSSCKQCSCLDYWTIGPDYQQCKKNSLKLFV